MISRIIPNVSVPANDSHPSLSPSLARIPNTVKVCIFSHTFGFVIGMGFPFSFGNMLILRKPRSIDRIIADVRGTVGEKKEDDASGGSARVSAVAGNPGSTHPQSYKTPFPRKRGRGGRFKTIIGSRSTSGIFGT